MNDLTAVTVFVTGLVMAAGVGLTYLGYSAYRRTRRGGLRSLTLGFCVLTAGVLLGGIGPLLGIETDVSVLLENSLFAVGFGLLIHSLYARDERIKRTGPDLATPD